MLIWFVLWLLIPLPALAYLDLGSGSYFLQILFAFLFTMSLSIRSFWYRLYSFLRRGKKEEEKDDHTSDTNEGS
ncbi:MAG TPA: hypothetical protein VJB56_02240 [Candidatus Paceibacterota bacterium]